MRRRETNVLEYDFENSVGYWVCVTSHAMKRALDAELSRENITFRQWEVLAWLAMEGELSQVELAERLGIEAPTLVGILSRMERDDWLERTNCPDDRRKKLIRPTAKVRAVWDRTVACCHRVRERATEGIPPNQLTQFKKTCEQIRANLESSAERTPCDAVGERDASASRSISTM